MTLVLSDEDVARVLPMTDCIEAMETAYRDYALNEAVNIPAHPLHQPDVDARHGVRVEHPHRHDALV